MHAQLLRLFVTKSVKFNSNTGQQHNTVSAFDHIARTRVASITLHVFVFQQLGSAWNPPTCTKATDAACLLRTELHSGRWMRIFTRAWQRTLEKAHSSKLKLRCTPADLSAIFGAPRQTARSTSRNEHE